MNTLTAATHVVSWQPEDFFVDLVTGCWSLQPTDDYALGLTQVDTAACCRLPRDCDLFDLAAWVSAALNFPVTLTEIAPMRVYGVAPAAVAKVAA